jgi:hypothetical protein
MSKWEYCKLDEAKGKLTRYNLGGTKVSQVTDYRNLPELVIARLGNTGWEAFQVINSTWYFKRLITG